jgi:hypothetical protein
LFEWSVNNLLGCALGEIFSSLGVLALPPLRLANESFHLLAAARIAGESHEGLKGGEHIAQLLTSIQSSADKAVEVGLYTLQPFS